MMTAGIPSRGAQVFTWTVVGLTAILLVAGAMWHGISLEVQHRFWNDMFARFGGPMTFRFFLQPTMAAIAALSDWIGDARSHNSWLDSSEPARLREGLTSTARILLLGISMDVIYQLKELNTFYPAEAAIIALLLAVVPYFIFRWLIEIVARKWRGWHGGAP
jgi:hypothetical protein